MRSVTPKSRVNFSLLSLPAALLVLAALACLVPFTNKAYHIDDPLFIWTAQQIQDHPTNPYGFSVNWYDTATPMYEATENPPLASYYMALAAGLLGWGERALHLAFLLPAIAAVLGTYFLAQQLSPNPLLAGLLVLFTPVFLLSSTNLMCDTMMLAFWVWAVVLWIKGLNNDSPSALAASAVLMAAAALTKYFAVSLIPLLLLYSLVRKRQSRWWMLYFLIPLVVFSGYQWWIHALYGQWPLAKAGNYALQFRSHHHANAASKCLTALTFTGGSMIPVLLYAPLLRSRRAFVTSALIVAVLVFTAVAIKRLGAFVLCGPGGIRWLPVGQFVVLAAAGVGVLTLAFSDLLRRKDAPSLLLFAWTLGTFAFAAFTNWTVNGRSMLPMAPAVGILLTRALGDRQKSLQPRRQTAAICLLIPAALIALSVTWADYALANTARSAADLLRKRYSDQTRSIWLRGHWGFQYYMMEYRAGEPLDAENFSPELGDIVVVPEDSSRSLPMPPIPQNEVVQAGVIQLRTCRWLATMNSTVGAGFYADQWGPFPFALGAVPPERYHIFQIVSNSPEEHYSRSVKLSDEGDLDEAMRELMEALRLRPDYAQAHNNLGRLLAARGELDQAIMHFRQAVTTEPDYALAQFNLALALYQKGDYPQAMRHALLARKQGFKLPPGFLEAVRSKMGSGR